MKSVLKRVGVVNYSMYTSCNLDVYMLHTLYAYDVLYTCELSALHVMDTLITCIKHVRKIKKHVLNMCETCDCCVPLSRAGITVIPLILTVYPL